MQEKKEIVQKNSKGIKRGYSQKPKQKMSCDEKEHTCKREDW